MSTEVRRLEQAFWRYGAIRLAADGTRRLITDKVPGPLLAAYRRTEGTLDCADPDTPLDRDQRPAVRR